LAVAVIVGGMLASGPLVRRIVAAAEPAPIVGAEPSGANGERHKGDTP
jgi:hypothetical protein